jgi:heptaprenylglyceryl phosphate synthase
MFTFSKNAAQRVMRAVLLVERMHGSAAQAKGPRSASGKTECPLQVYLSGGYICVRAGHHVWWNSYTNSATVTNLEKTVADAWSAYTTGNRTIYVRRVYNSDGTASPVELVQTTDSYATVVGGITNAEARWVLATIADGVITQWRTCGDIDELRVA